LSQSTQSTNDSIATDFQAESFTIRLSVEIVLVRTTNLKRFGLCGSVYRFRFIISGRVVPHQVWH